MKTLSAFEVLGPRMVGPSSSHTAGAARLAKVAGHIAGPQITRVQFVLFGSFAHTYRGHGTDRALLAGIMGMEPDDPQLPNAYALAQSRGLAYSFVQSDAPSAHPNTVTMEIDNAAGKHTSITGISIGGGAIVLTQLNGIDIYVTGEYPTLIVDHQDVPGVIGDITQALGREQINIAFMRVFRQARGGQAYMVIETDQAIPQAIIGLLQNVRKEIGHVYLV